MIGFNQYGGISLCIVATAFLVACTNGQQFWASTTAREIGRVKSRSVPSDGSLLRESEPVRDASSVRAKWEVQTTSDNRAYFQWLKNQLGPEYHVTSETATTMTLVKGIEGDAYTVTIQGSGAPAHAVEPECGPQINSDLFSKRVRRPKGQPYRDEPEGGGGR